MVLVLLALNAVTVCENSSLDSCKACRRRGKIFDLSGRSKNLIFLLSFSRDERITQEIHNLVAEQQF